MNLQIQYKEDEYTIPESRILEADDSIRDLVEYVEEALIRHDRDLGRTTVSNRHVGEHMEEAIRRANNCRNYLRSLLHDRD